MMIEPKASGNGFDFNRPTIVALLYLASFAVGLTGIVGLVLAYVWKSEPHEAWEATHYSYHIRTFWFGLLGIFIGTVLTLVLIGILILIAVAVWVIVRSVLSLIKAQKREAMPDPQTLLF
ncbi:MAG: DUF4870 family protein [Sphingomonadaceae bacterium]